MPNTDVTLYTDGSSHNLGEGIYQKAGIGIHSSDLNITIGLYLGDGISSNCCEYEAIIAAMKIAVNRGVSRLTIKSDSELCVKQILKNCLGRPGYACSDKKLIPRLEIVKELIDEFKFFNIVHIRRGLNSEADDAADKAVKDKKIIAIPSSWTTKYVTFQLDKDQMK